MPLQSLTCDDQLAYVVDRHGVEVTFGERTLKCQNLETFDFSKCDFALMSAGGAVSKEWSPRIGATGCIVIDNSSAWRMEPDTS